MRKNIVCVLLLSFMCMAGTVFATPYWDESDFEAFTARGYSLGGEREIPKTPALGYSYPYQFARLAEFESIWQVPDSASPNCGGMREGECCGLETIVETDNTQEAIWIWCRYGQMMNDTSTYRPNIDAAWVYVSKNPAYAEEGTDSPYYRIHNCGWALVACEIFEEVYGDASKRQYADSCADYICARKDSLTFSDFSFYGRLHPMVAGWGAGTLYKYGQFIGSQAYVDTALALGARVADWVDSNSTSRLSDEVWAMSSGTAMWGVVNSVVKDNLPGWSAWLTTLAESLQVYQDASTWSDWNNSWNVWYANAASSIGKALAAPEYVDNHRMLVDTLLAQDRDGDGGIPANTMHPDTMDQTWVTCYLGMMGIGGLMDSLPDHDVGPIGFVSPRQDLIIPVGDSVAVAVAAVNYGLTAENGVPVQVTGAYSAGTTVDLPVAAVDTAVFAGNWIPLTDSVYELTAFSLLGADQNGSNDTVRISITVLPEVIVSGSVKDSVTQNGISANLYFLRSGPPADTLWDSTSTDGSGNFSLSLVTGTYSVEINPAVPYPKRMLAGVRAVKDSTTTLDVKLMPATLLVVDDDEGETYEDYYTSSLDSIGVSYICWDVYRQGVFPISLMSLFGSPIVIWLTGDALNNTLTPEDQDSLSAFLDSGGSLFITGQNVGQDIGADPFYTNYLHSAYLMPTTNDHTIIGAVGDEIGDGLSILSAGSPGAGNQNSQDVISPAAGADSVLLYNPLDCAGIKYDSGTYKVVYFGFGFEGIASRPSQGYNTNWYVMKRILHWFDPSIVGAEDEMVSFRPEAVRVLRLGVSPNPFSAQAVIEFAIPAGADGRTSLCVYNVSGRLVRTIPVGKKSPYLSLTGRAVWDGSGGAGRKLPSGAYFVRLEAGGRCLTKKLVFLR